MLRIKLLHFKPLLLFLLTINFCLLFDELLVAQERSPAFFINTPIISVVEKISLSKIAKVENYQQIDKESLAKTLIDKAHQHNDLGQFRFSIPLLEQAISLAQKSQNQEIIIVAQGELGNSYTLAGNYDRALEAYQTSLNLAQEIGNQKYITIALNSQVNIFQVRRRRYLTQAKEAQIEKNSAEVLRLLSLAEQDLSAAHKAGSRAINVSKVVGDIPQVKALLNGIKLSLAQDLTTQYRQQVISIVSNLPPSRSTAYALIQLAEYQIGKAKVDSLKRASDISSGLGDLRTQSFALGALAHTYEQEKQFALAIELTQQAQNAAQQVRAMDSLYQWQWQAGRIYAANGEPDQAIASYKQAIASLQSIRSDIITANPDLQFDVRDSVEPVYRELIALLLDNGQAQEALGIFKLLKLTELENFFSDECLEVKNTLNATEQYTGSKEATINSIILSDRTYTILSLPDGTLKSYPVSIDAAEIQNQVEQFRTTLEDFATDRYLEPAQKLYDLLLRPMEADLAKSKLSSLRFISDGVLRNVPMAALHDGKHFLVEKYAVSNSLGLELMKAEVPRKAQKALVFGLTVEVPPFASLPSVSAETQTVSEILGGNRFLDREFTLANLEKQVVKQKNYSVLHIATHGNFSGTINNTFLQAIDSRISLKEFEDVLLANNERVDLLTLSACQTAAGDNRSILGLAGLAVRTGVKNVLASLWFVNDADTVKLMENFYTQISQSGASKAEALRVAQISLISSLHPAIWSSFILVVS